MKSNVKTILILGACLFLFSCTPSTDPENLRDELQAKGTISGFVTDMNGDPIEGVHVKTDADSAVPDFTDSNGKFKIGRVIQGTHTLEFTHMDYEDVSDGYEVAVKYDEDKVMDDIVRLSYKWYRFTGRIVYNNSGVPGAGIKVSGYPFSDLTDDKGGFMLDKIPMDDDLKLICARSGIGFTALSGVQGQRDEIVELPDIELQEKGATVMGVVYDVEGHPVKNIVVAAVGGGVVDTTDTEGEYMLKNVPSNERDIVIYVPLNGDMSGSITGIVADEGGLVTGADIYLHQQADYTNGMYIDVNDVIVSDEAGSVKITVFPSILDSTVIESFQWFVTDSVSAASTTTSPSYTLELSSASPPENIDLWVQTINTDSEYSLKHHFRVMVRSGQPVVSAGGAVSNDSAIGDTVRIDLNGTVRFQLLL